MEIINIYTDGSARRNGRVNSSGGFGVVIIQDNELKYAYSEQHLNVTNNQMELKAIIHAFELSQEKFSDQICLVYSDSLYCVKSCNSWIRKWAANGWINSKQQVVENLDLMKQLYSFLSIDFFNAEVHYCGGHKGTLGNELADALATNNKIRFYGLLEVNHIKYDKENIQFVSMINNNN